MAGSSLAIAGLAPAKTGVYPIGAATTLAERAGTAAVRSVRGSRPPLWFVQSMATPRSPIHPPHPPHPRVVHFRRTESTQSLARAWVAGREGCEREPVLFVADEQTGGVGRFARAWASPVGGLWCTLAWPLDRAVLDGLGLRLGVACTEFVASLLHPAHAGRVRMKWPNDVLIDGRKVLGVLAEYVPGAVGGGEGKGERGRGGWLLVGVGLNANFPEEPLPPLVRDTATTLKSTAGLTIDLAGAALLLAGALADAIPPEADAGRTVERARALLHGIGEHARVTLPGGEKIDATLIGLDAGGDAVVETGGSRWVLPGGAVVVSA